MLPKVLPENQIQVFKFWFGGALQDGTHYNDELYYRALTVERNKRTRLYHLACKFSQRGAVVLVSLNNTQCNLWISLRHQNMAYQLMDSSVQGLLHPLL